MKFTCTECNKTFKSERKLGVHSLFVHNVLRPECKNWKAIDQHNLKIERMYTRAKDLIQYLERCLKGVDKDRLKYASNWYYIKKELKEIEKELIENRHYLPKKSLKLTILVIVDEWKY